MAISIAYAAVSTDLVAKGIYRTVNLEQAIARAVGRCIDFGPKNQRQYIKGF